MTPDNAPGKQTDIWVHETDTSDGWKTDIVYSLAEHLERKEWSDGFTQYREVLPETGKIDEILPNTGTDTKNGHELAAGFMKAIEVLKNNCSYGRMATPPIHAAWLIEEGKRLGILNE
jgi:hypothetical protein